MSRQGRQSRGDVKVEGSEQVVRGCVAALPYFWKEIITLPKAFFFTMWHDFPSGFIAKFSVGLVGTEQRCFSRYQTK